jgi:hypothetical protein
VQPELRGDRPLADPIRGQLPSIRPQRSRTNPTSSYVSLRVNVAISRDPIHEELSRGGPCCSCEANAGGSMTAIQILQKIKADTEKLVE